MHTFTFGEKYLITNKKTKKSMWFIYDGVTATYGSHYLGEPIHRFRHQSINIQNKLTIHDLKSIANSMYLVSSVDIIEIGDGLKLNCIYSMMPESIANEYKFKHISNKKRNFCVKSCKNITSSGKKTETKRRAKNKTLRK